jgi:hypothetical protein
VTCFLFCHMPFWPRRLWLLVVEDALKQGSLLLERSALLM